MASLSCVGVAVMAEAVQIDSDVQRDAGYYRARELQERDSAAKADGDWARDVHLAMAERYAAVVRRMTGDQLAA